MQQAISDNEISAPETRETASPSPLHKSRSAERVLSLLDIVVTNSGLSLTTAAERAGMPASTALRHLRVLMGHGYLVRDDLGRYSAGPSFLRIALASFQSGPYAQLTAVAQPRLEELVATTEESAYLAVRDGAMAVYVATVESRRAIRHVGWVGRSVPLDGTAVGKALLGDALEPGIRPEPVFNTGSIEPDVTAVVAPIHGTSGVLAALSVLGPADRLTGRRLDTAANAIVEAATSMALALSSPKQALA